MVASIFGAYIPLMKRLVLLFVCYTTIAYGQVLPKMHSHNDYHQDAPFWAAYNTGAQSIEIDVILKDNELYVAHDRVDIEKDRTIERLYIQPLEQLQAKGEYIHTVTFLVDFKTAAKPTMKRLLEITAKYPAIFNDKPNGVRLIISGNRPKQEKYAEHPAYILFDGRKPEEMDKAGSEKIGLISRNFSDFSKWRGEGKLPEKDSLKLAAFVNDCHQRKAEVRFWNTPDVVSVYHSLIRLDVDYINTDKPSELARFLETYKIEEE